MLRETPTYHFPPCDLIESLIDTYSRCIHPFHPCLHMPSFRALVAQGTYLRPSEHHFGAIVLLVCALAARFSDDPRVLLPKEQVENAHARFSSGWQWYDQLVRVRRQHFEPPKLYDLQFYCVSLSSQTTPF